VKQCRLIGAAILGLLDCGNAMIARDALHQFID